MGVDTIKVPSHGYGLTNIFKVQPDKRDKVQTTLSDWMDENNLGKDALAVAIGVNHQTITNWRNGQVYPGLVEAFLLERLSKGKVPVATWLGVPPAIARFQQLEAKRKSRQAGNYSVRSQKAGGVRR